MTPIEPFLKIASLFLSFFKRRTAGERKEFTELVEGQYTYLMEVIGKSQRDYFELSERVKELSRKLNESLAWQCKAEDCRKRE